MTPELIWFLVGLGLVLLEFVVPGVILVFFGFGAWVAALTTWVGLTPGLAAQSVVFALASLALLFGLRRFVRQWFLGDTKDRGGEHLEEFVGKEVIVASDIPGGHGTGKVELKGAEWRARSEASLAKGALAVVTARDGLVLVVSPR